MKKNFSVTPSVSISRSKFLRPSQHKTSIKLGEITPIYLDEVLPGDTRKIDMAALVRMNTPVAPIMDNVFVDYYAFFCPNRIAWPHFKEFMGENNSSAGIYTGTEFTIPMTNLFANGVPSGSLGDHFGLPIIAADASKSLMVSDLPIRMYRIIYNEWFRDQNLISPLFVNTSDSGAGGYYLYPAKAAKVSDYFTRALPYAQKGAPVKIPLGTTAPVRILDGLQGSTSVGHYAYMNLRNSVSPDTQLSFGLSSKYNNFAGGNSKGVTMLESSGAITSVNNDAAGASADWVNPTSNYHQVIADLSQATAATINQLRFAFQYQKMLEKDALYGTRYWEILNAHFGVQAPDSSLQRPELLGHWRQNINIDQVIQTTGINQSTPGSNSLGQTAAVSVTGGKGNLVTKSFTEHGYIMILAVARHEQTYGQGVSRDWTRVHRTDFYFPVFANLGAQAVKNKEIFAVGDTTSGDDLEFGYQEAWAEYRYKPSVVTGRLRPNVTGLGYWTLANNFASLPTLSQSFIEQDRSNLARAIGSFDQDFICDFYFKDIAVRPMPLYSVPGLIDHH